MANIKNVIIFVIIAVVIFGGYWYFLKPSPEDKATLVSSAGTTAAPAAPSANSPASGAAAQKFLSLLLNVKNIKLEDGIFSDPAFLNLRDSSIVLNPEGNEGRINPFAKLGTDAPPPPEPGLEETAAPEETEEEAPVSDEGAPAAEPEA